MLSFLTLFTTKRIFIEKRFEVVYLYSALQPRVLLKVLTELLKVFFLNVVPKVNFIKLITNKTLLPPLNTLS